VGAEGLGFVALWLALAASSTAEATRFWCRAEDGDDELS